jgi:hypothetical protein
LEDLIYDFLEVAENKRPAISPGVQSEALKRFKTVSKLRFELLALAFLRTNYFKFPSKPI